MAARRVRWTHQLARPEQIPDTTDWKVWLYLAGRGAGKTRTAAEWLAFQASRNSKTRWAIVALNADKELRMAAICTFV